MHRIQQKVTMNSHIGLVRKWRFLLPVILAGGKLGKQVFVFLVIRHFFAIENTGRGHLQLNYRGQCD